MSYQVFIYNAETNYFQLDDNDVVKLAKKLKYDKLTCYNVEEFEEDLNAEYQDFVFHVDVDIDPWSGEAILGIGITVNYGKHKSGNENATYWNIIKAVARFKKDNDLTTVFDIVDENGEKCTVNNKYVEYGIQVFPY